MARVKQSDKNNFNFNYSLYSDTGNKYWTLLKHKYTIILHLYYVLVLNNCNITNLRIAFIIIHQRSTMCVLFLFMCTLLTVLKHYGRSLSITSLKSDYIILITMLNI